MTRLRLLARLTMCALAAAMSVAAPCRGADVESKSRGFEIVDVDGAAVSLDGLLKENRLVLLNFWGIRCGACIEEIPHLNRIQAENQGKVAVLGVNVDGIGAKTLKEQMKQMPVTMAYRVVPDPELQLAETYQLMGAPLTILIDATGAVRYRHENYAPGDEKKVAEEIRKALAQ